MQILTCPLVSGWAALSPRGAVVGGLGPDIPGAALAQPDSTVAVHAGHVPRLTPL